MVTNTAALPMVITPSVLIERARTIAAKWAGRGMEIDKASKLPDDLVAEWIDAGLIATLVPKRFGGYELGLDTASEITRIFAAFCPSSAWVLSFYMGHNWIHCQFPEEAQQEIFADGPSPCSAGVLAPLFKLKAVEGGYRVTGRNSWNSGAPHAGWIMSSGIVLGEGASGGPVTFIMPRSDVTLIDTWEMEGMRATGSWDVTVEDVFIPAHRTVPTAALFSAQTPGSLVHANSFYTRPLALLSFGYPLPVFVGALRGVADEFTANIKTRVGTNDGKSAAAKQVMQMLVGRGEARAQLAEAMLADLIDSIMASDNGVRFEVPARLAVKARGAMLVEFCKETISELVLGAGANAFRKQSKLQMIFRDINMISAHAFFEQGAATEGFGRSLLGMEPIAPI